MSTYDLQSVVVIALGLAVVATIVIVVWSKVR